jgi:F-type H+-transporting ATPase subunit alpha
MTADTLQAAVDQAFTDLRTAREASKPELKPREIGLVTSVSTGVAQVSGLPGVGFEELLEFPDGLLGIAFNVTSTRLVSCCWATIKICGRALR